jgi:hypothetical protein
MLGPALEEPVDLGTGSRLGEEPPPLSPAEAGMGEHEEVREAAEGLG